MDQLGVTDGAGADRWARLMALFGLRGGYITRAKREAQALEDGTFDQLGPQRLPEERGGIADPSGTTT